MLIAKDSAASVTSADALAMQQVVKWNNQKHLKATADKVEFLTGDKNSKLVVVGMQRLQSNKSTHINTDLPHTEQKYTLSASPINIHRPWIYTTSLTAVYSDT